MRDNHDFTLYLYVIDWGNELAVSLKSLDTRWSLWRFKATYEMDGANSKWVGCGLIKIVIIIRD